MAAPDPPLTAARSQGALFTTLPNVFVTLASVMRSAEPRRAYEGGDPEAGASRDNTETPEDQPPSLPELSLDARPAGPQRRSAEGDREEVCYTPNHLSSVIHVDRNQGRGRGRDVTLDPAEQRDTGPPRSESPLTAAARRPARTLTVCLAGWLKPGPERGPQ